MTMAEEFAARGNALREKLLGVAEKLEKKPRQLKPLSDYAALAQEKTWPQRWDHAKRGLAETAFSVSGKVWSDAIDASLAEQNGVFIPKMTEPLYLERSIVVESGCHIVVDPATEIRMIIDEVEHALIRNKNIASGREKYVELCAGADKDILIQGGIWSDQKNNGHGPQGFRKGKEGLMYGSQGAFVFSNVENIVVRGATFKDTSSFGIQIGNCRNYLVEDLLFDGTKDGVHVEGPSEYGIIRNIKGPLTGDDVIALNAWDWRTSSVTFGDITDVLVEDVEIAAGSLALRILPGIKIYPDGAIATCDIARCVFADIRNCHTIKMYDQPNVRCVSEDYSGGLGQVSELYFKDMQIAPHDLTKHHDKSKNSVVDLCEHARDLYFENICVNYEFGGNYPQYFIKVGPKSNTGRIPFKKSGTQEMFNPDGKPVAKNIILNGLLVPDKQGGHLKHPAAAELVTCTSYPERGEGKVEGVQVF